MIPGCRFCGKPASGVFMLDRGCVALPDDRVQALCAWHEWKAEPLGHMICLTAFA